MKAILLLVLVVILVGGGLKMAGVRLPLIDYPIGPIGIDGPGPAMPGVQIDAPGFDDVSAP
jgi:hypothetical protein